MKKGAVTFEELEARGFEYPLAQDVVRAYVHDIRKTAPGVDAFESLFPESVDAISCIKSRFDLSDMEAHALKTPKVGPIIAKIYAGIKEEDAIHNEKDGNEDIVMKMRWAVSCLRVVIEGIQGIGDFEAEALYSVSETFEGLIGEIKEAME